MACHLVSYDIFSSKGFRVVPLTIEHLESPDRLAYSLNMRSIKEIEEEISQLNPDDRRRIANWLAEFEADLWDQQIAKDAADGKLDRFINEAIEEYHEQKTRPLP